MNHVWAVARRERKRLDSYACVRCGSAEGLEVNHRVPVRERGYVYGCQHHLENLETLCHTHHAQETARQQKVWDAS